MAQRLVRAKGKIRDARIPYRVPDAGELPGRVRSALAVVYLVFNEGYAATSGPHLVRDDLCREAIRLGRVLHELMPGDMEVVGLLALMLLLQSRRAARVSASGELVSLREQDRAHWDRELVAEGQALVRRCLAANRPGPYQLQAAVSAVHADATRAADTDWGQILALYDHMMQLAPSPIVALNRAVAVAEVHGPDAALDAIAGLDLPAYPLFHAVRADFLARVGRTREACQEYDTAIGITENAVERAFLVRERAKVVLDGRPWKVD
jgi:RNA polymerase sigma-70 factor (ECF subfamily)